MEDPQEERMPITLIDEERDPIEGRIILLKPDIHRVNSIGVRDWEWIKLVPIGDDSEESIRRIEESLRQVEIQYDSPQKYVVTCVHEVPNVRALAFNESVNTHDANYQQVPFANLIWCSSPCCWEDIYRFLGEEQSRLRRRSIYLWSTMKSAGHALRVATLL